MNLNQLIEFYNDGNNYNVERLLKLSDQFMLELSLSANSIEDLFVKGNELFFPKIEITGENNLKNTQNVIFAFNHPTTFDIFPISKLFSTYTNLKIVNRLQNSEKYPSISALQKKFDERFIFTHDVEKIVKTLRSNGSIVMCPLLYLDSHLTEDVIELQIGKLAKLARLNNSKIVFGKLHYDWSKIPFRNISIEIMEALSYQDITKIRENSYHISNFNSFQIN